MHMRKESEVISCSSDSPETMTPPPPRCRLFAVDTLFLVALEVIAVRTYYFFLQSQIIIYF